MDRILFVDDEPLVLEALKRMLKRHANEWDMAFMSDSQAACARFLGAPFDVVVSDLQMPKMDGLTFLERLMKSRPMPVVMVSSYTQEGSETAMRSLELGAVDIIEKPKFEVREGLNEIAILITDKVKAAAQAKMKTARQIFMQTSPKQSTEVVLPKTTGKRKTTDQEPLIAIGASTGGTEVLREILSSLPPNLPGIVIVQHMPKAFTGSFANSLDRVSELEIKEAEDGDMVESGKALLAPGDAHMILKTNGSSYQVKLDKGELVNRHRPAVDVLFRSVASIAGSAAVGVILTGMGNDGAKGMTEMHDQGALTLAQDQESCVVYGMPKVAVESGAVDQSLTPEQIVKRLIEWS